MMRRMVLSMLAVGLMGIGAAPAVAAPSYDETDKFTITCGEDTFDVTMGPGLGVWTPAFVVDSDQRVIPYAISGTFEFEDPDTGEIISKSVDPAKNAPKNGRLEKDCTFEDGGFGGLLDGTVSFTLTPG